MSTMNLDETGVAINCFGAQRRDLRDECTAFASYVQWYNGKVARDRCKGCPFFKTVDEYNAGRNTMQLNELGIAINCFGVSVDHKECTKLTDWGGKGKNKCAGCPFFKTKQVYDNDLQRSERRWKACNKL